MTNEVVTHPMANAFRTLDAEYGTIPGEMVVRQPRELIVQPVITDTVTDQERANDIAVVRETLHRIMQKSEDALDDVLNLARSSEHPRAFEVAGQMIKNVGDIASQLIDLHKKAKEISKVAENPREAALNGGAHIENQTNVVFTGTAQDLMKAIKLTREKDMGNVIDG